MRQFQEAYTMLNAAAATGSGLPMLVSDFRDLLLTVSSANSGSFTLKVQGSIATAKPDFASSASPSNLWTYLQIIDLADQSVINGATGVVATGTDINRQFEVNINGQNWLNVIVTAYSAGNITAVAQPFNSNE